MKLKCKKKGVTLLEVIVSVAILAVISVPVGGMLITSVKTNKQVEDKQKAALLGQEILEEIKVVEFDDLGVTKLSNGIEIEKDSVNTDGLITYKATSNNEVNGFNVSIDLVQDKNSIFGQTVANIEGLDNFF
ncbi:MAG: prepilin-type N-terminal cleavage/methylation domain-containing protein [Streptococcus gallolyticus]|nr:prepilin-type N-terminal cleavage/methylation domain-containing protein [Streptococcus gallolyticus]